MYLKIAMLGSLALCLLSPLQLSGQLLSNGIVNTSRSADWTHAGATIATGYTQCGSTVAAGTSAATVQGLINACAPNTYLLLGPGSFSFTTGLVLKSNIILRGSGSNSTFLSFSGSNGCSGSASNICVPSGDTNYWGGPTNTANWTAGYTQGATSITLSSTTNLAVGNPLILDQIDTQADNSALYVGCERGSSNPPGDSSTDCYSGAGPSGFQRGNSALTTIRGQQQVVKVTNISGTTVTISPGLYAGNWASGNSPGAWWATSPILNVGIENLSIDNSPDNTTCGASGGSCADGITFFNCENCWVKGVRSILTNADPTNGVSTGWAHIQWEICNHCTVRDSYLFGYLGDAYQIAANLGSDNLVENNIVQFPSLTQFYNADCEGCVSGYNFSASQLFHGPSANWLLQPSNFHSIDLYALEEGNIGAGHYGDSFHGTHDLDTFFRNRMDGNEPNAGNAISSNTVAMRLNPGSRYYNVVANIMGTVGYHSVYKSNINGSNTYSSVIGCGAYGEAGMPGDALSCPTSLWWGNWDNVTNAVRWCGNSSDTGWVGTCASTTEIPLSATGYPNSLPTLGDTGAGQSALPASFYYAAKPSWWPSGKAWPIIGPDITGGNVGQCNGGTNAKNEVISSQSSQCTGGSFTALATVISNPAMDCYFGIMGGPANGTGSALAFDASTCFASTPTLSAPNFTPSTLSAPGWVTISNSTTGAACFYTRDGSTPTMGSTAVTTHLYVAGSETIKAICSKAGFTNSPVGSQSYSPTVTPQFYISANSASDIPTPYPFINRCIACEWQDVLSSPSTSCATYNWAPLDSWITQSASHGSVNMYTFSHIPQCANGTTNDANPPTDIASGNTFFKNFVDKFWEHLGGISSIPANPTSYTNYKNMLYIELWNELNVGLYWTGTGAQMATMWTTALTESRKFCSDCIFIGGSTSAGGKGNEYYYTASLGVLQNLGTQKPDIASFHPYPCRTDVHNCPFVDTIESNNDSLCPGTPNIHCDVSVAGEAAYFRQHVLQDVSVIAWAGTLGIGTSEGGYGINDAVCDVLDGDWTHANVKTLRGAYVAQWMMAMEDAGTLFNLAYVDKDQRWMTFTGNGGASGATHCTQPAFTGKTAVNAGFNQMLTWLTSFTPSGPKVCTGASTFTMTCTLPGTVSSNPAEIKYYTGWLTTHSQSTSFTTQQNLQGTTSATGGTVTLSQEPILLTSPGTTFTLSTATAGTGAGTISGCAGSLATGASYSCTVTASSGSTLASVTGCGGSGTTTYAGIMPASNCTVTATFTLNSYTLSTATAGSGSGTVTGCAGSHLFGAAYSCSVTASTGSTLTSVSGCGGSGTTTYAGTQPASNCTVTATFTLNTYTLTVGTAGTGTGSISGCTSGTFNYGTAVSCTATPGGGSFFAGWSGGSCSGTGSCSFSLAANSTVTATFTLTPVVHVRLDGAQTFTGPQIQQ